MAKKIIDELIVQIYPFLNGEEKNFAGVRNNEIAIVDNNVPSRLDAVREIKRLLDENKYRAAIKITINSLLRDRFYKRYKELLHKASRVQFLKNRKENTLEMPSNKPSAILDSMHSDLWWQIRQVYASSRYVDTANSGILTKSFLTSHNLLVVSGFSSILNKQTLFIDDQGNFYQATVLYKEWPSINDAILNLFFGAEAKELFYFAVCLNCKVVPKSISLAYYKSEHKYPASISILSELSTIERLPDEPVKALSEIYKSLSKFSVDMEDHVRSFDSKLAVDLIKNFKLKNNNYTNEVFTRELTLNVDITIVIYFSGSLDVLENQILNFAEDLSDRVESEIIVVNDSPDSRKILRSRIQDLKITFGSRIRLIESYSQGGKAEAMNTGARYAKGEYCIFLSDYAVQCDRGLIQSLYFSTADKDSLILSAQVVTYDGRVISFVPNTELEDTWLGESTSQVSMQYIHNFDAITSELMDVQYARLECFLVRRDTYLSAGGMSVEFVGDTIYSDIEYSLRARQKGVRLAIVPSAKVTHLSGYKNKLFPPEPGLNDYIGSINRDMLSLFLSQKQSACDSSLNS